MTRLVTDTALRYRELGFRPIPIIAGSKRAAIKWKTLQTRAPTEEEIAEWFSASERSVALLTGNGIAVVDVDDANLLHFAISRCGDTPMRCRTPSGGMHLYYALPPGVALGNAVRIHGRPIDLRCEGAYAVCPWSRSSQGVSYEWVGDVVPAGNLPPLTLSWIRQRKPDRVVMPLETDCDPRRAIRRARRYVATIEGAISGMRGHDRTFRVACVLTTKFGLSLEEAWPLFLEWNTQCEPPWSEKELRHKLEDAERQRGPIRRRANHEL